LKIELNRLTVRDVLEGYTDKAEDGVTAFRGLLDIRPKYQREFVYKDKQRDSVIETIKKNFPLNVMYWMKRDNGGFEVLDGQQRTISIGQYVNGDYSINEMFFHNLTKTEQDQILDYELMIYFCEGTDQERLDWFQVINIAGEKLTDQEIRNAVYTGTWLSDAKLKFSKRQCAAYLLANENGKLVSGDPNRQEYLETVLSWINNGNVREYMSFHQHDENAEPLWQYFKQVIGWVRDTFPHYRSEMTGVDWGSLYNVFGEIEFNPSKLEKEIVSLMQDEDVTRKSGIYPFVLNRKERNLSIRAFTPNMKREAHTRQNGVCPKCGQAFPMEKMEADHKKLWSEGGRTIAVNCQMLCIDCHREKSNR
jgi:ribosomal protein S27AE